MFARWRAVLQHVVKAGSATVLLRLCVSAPQPSLASHPSFPPTPTLPPLQVQVVPPKKKVVDDYVIILACVLGGLLVLPLVAWVGRRAWLAHQHRKVRWAGLVG